MKKILAVILSAAMCMTFAATAMAAEGPAISVGGWTINSDITENPMPDDTADVFASAMEGLVGVEYTPIAVLGEQVVSGTNIAYLCAATTVTQVPETYLALVVVYKDLDGKASVNSITKLDLGKLADEAFAEDAQGVTFTMEISNTLTGESEQSEVTTDAATLGDYMRTMEGCEWEDSEYGIFVTSINGVANDDETSSYWSYYVNGEYAMVGADECQLEDGMQITWAYESYAAEE